MKKIISFLSLCCLVSLYGCGTAKDAYPWPLGAESDLVLAADSGVTLEMKADTLESSGAVFLFTNAGERQISFDQEDNPLQIYTDGSWHEISVQYDIAMELIILQPGETYEFAVDWSGVYGNLPAGQYRLVKNYSASEKNAFITCEFVIPETGK